MGQPFDQIDQRTSAVVTDAEVLQEILHRYVAISRPDAVQPAFDALLGIGIHRILTFDSGFDGFPDITRIS